MKSGLLVYTPLNGRFNIGDYIQSIAARQFFKVDNFIYVDRDELNKYCGDNVKLIMNGWYSHKPKNWPPSSNINPLIVSIHINETIKEYFLTDESITYLKKYEPIGCRDYNTKEMLESKGIRSYFSGCMTLTLGQTYKNTKNREKIYIVDPFFEFKKDLFSLLKYCWIALSKSSTIKNIYNKTKNSIFIPYTGFKGVIMVSALYRQFKDVIDDDVFKSAEFICQEFYDKDFKSFDEKFNKADELLTKYKDAKYVITSRIHCALPCLGMGTPVAFVLKENDTIFSSCRFRGLVEFFNTITIADGKVSQNFLNDKFTCRSIFKNKSNFIPFKDQLVERCMNFTKE